MNQRQPAEWAPHSHVWTAWPSDPDMWLHDLEPARAELAAFIRAIDDEGRGEAIELLAATEEAVASAQRATEGTRTRVRLARFGDIWLRDTGPIFTVGDGRMTGMDFGFNGWGGKYEMDGDNELATVIARLADVPIRRASWVLEGGAVDVDGTGLAVLTEQCVLNPNRNTGFTRAEVETRLGDDLGIDNVLWLGDGMLNDHTDGHVDNLARFVGEGVLALPEPAGEDDPNAAVFRDARARAIAFGVEVVPVPSVGRFELDGEIVPASYMNFYIANNAVIVPTYGAPNDDAAVRTIGGYFPGRRAIGLRANHILTGGGSFHCITQQQPAL
jgi:agmatine deiminase